MSEEKSRIQILQVPEGYSNERVDKVLASCLRGWTRSKIQKLLDAGAITRDGIILEKNDSVKSGDHLSIVYPQDTSEPVIQPVQQALNILYEDEALIVLNKPPYTTVHPGSGTGNDTLVHALLYHCKGKLSQRGGDPSRPGVVHRLDKETSGLIIFAKQDAAYLSLTQQFKDRTVKKEYLALVRGVPRFPSGSIQAHIQRHLKVRTKMQVSKDGRFAHTDWQVEDTFLERFALLRCFLFTGRTHQIRVHLAHMHHPIMGDTLYGYRLHQADPIHPKRVLLHAQRLAFCHPLTHVPLSFETPLPKDFQSILTLLEEVSASVSHTGGLV